MTINALFLLLFLSSTRSYAEPGLEVGRKPMKTTLTGPDGSRITGEAWSSVELVGSKITSFFYIDPEERKLNEPVEAAYKAADFPREKHQSIAVLNMAAAWYPNSVLNSQLEKKQQEFPHTIYLKDFKKVLVNSWQLKDDSVNVVIFDRDSTLLYLKKGVMAEKDIADALQLIRSKL